MLLPLLYLIAAVGLGLYDALAAAPRFEPLLFLAVLILIAIAAVESEPRRRRIRAEARRRRARRGYVR